MSEPGLGAMWLAPEMVAEVARLEQENRQREEENHRLQGVPMAAYEGRSERIWELLAAGWPLNDPHHGGCEALRWAVYGGQHDLIRELLTLGASLEVDSILQETALAAAVHHLYLPGERAPDPVPLELLLAAGARLRLHEAVLMNNLTLARTRLDEGANPNFGEDEYFGSVLMIAAANGNTAMVALLLDRGANIEATDDLGQRALMFAAQAGQVAVTCLLVDRGAFTHAVSWSNQTASMIARLAGHDDLANFLSSRGAHPDEE